MGRGSELEQAQEARVSLSLSRVKYLSEASKRGRGGSDLFVFVCPRPLSLSHYCHCLSSMSLSHSIVFHHPIYTCSRMYKSLLHGHTHHSLLS